MAATKLIGKGLKDGLCYEESFAWLKQIRQQGDGPSRAAALQTVMANGAWSSDRCHQAGFALSVRCEFCGVDRQTWEHLLYFCPFVRQQASQHEEEAVACTEEIVQEAQEGWHVWPSFWLRGLLPARLVQIPVPSRLVFLTAVAGSCPAPLAGARWPAGTYHTDGSGGRFSAQPLLRRCSFGISSVALGVDGKPCFRFGFHGNLPDTPQTVPRSELFAWLVVLQNVEPEGAIEIVTDSEVCVETFAKQRNRQGEIDPDEANADMWRCLWHLLQQRNGGIASLAVKTPWAKAHSYEARGASQADELCKVVAKGPGTMLLDVFGNSCADRLACFGQAAIL